jgi:hypothetical protein
MSYIVAHCRKVQTAVGLAAVGRHNCREAVYDEQGRALGKLPKYIVHPERAAMNEGDRCGASNILKNRSKRVQEANLGRKPQKNAAAAIEANISASADWFAAHKPDEWQKFFKDARKFMAEKYGKENLLHWVVHYDEQTPHMHVLMTPIIEGKDGPRYSSSNFLGGRKGLRDLQTEIAATLGDKYGLVRGQEGSNARHTDQYEWIEDTARMRKELERKEKALAEREAKIAKLEKIATAQVKPFGVILCKEKPGLFPKYETSDGRHKGLTRDEYVTRESVNQAFAYGKKVEEIARAAQVKAAEYEEAATKTLPLKERQLSETIDKHNAIVNQVNAYTPAQLRALANQREAERARAQEQRRDRDKDRGITR